MGAIRLFLAYGVVFGHECEYAVNFQISCDTGWMLNVIGGRAVVFFYIVSGFLMSYVLDSKYPRTKAGTYQFYKSRFLRIYPLWWAIVVFSTVTLSAAWLHRSPPGVFSAIFLFGSDWLVPFAHYPEADFGFFPIKNGDRVDARRGDDVLSAGAMAAAIRSPGFGRTGRLTGGQGCRVHYGRASRAGVQHLHYLELFFSTVDIHVFHARAFGQARSLHQDCRPVARACDSHRCGVVCVSERLGSDWRLVPDQRLCGCRSVCSCAAGNFRRYQE